MAASADTREYQRGQVALRAVAYSDTSLAWRLLDPTRLDATFPKFATAILGIIETRRATSGELARQYLAVRRRGVPGAPPEVFVPKLDRAAAVESLRIVSVISIKSAMTRGVALPLATRNALVRTMGVVDRFVGDGGRELIRASIEADPAAQGWVRVTLGTCDYCADLARGDGLKSGSSDFPRHDHCGCQPEPVYDGGLQPEDEFVQKIKGMIERGEITEEQFRAMLLDPNVTPLGKLNVQTALDQLAAERTFPQEALDALLPKRGGWTTSTRTKTIAELKKTPEGRQLLKTMDSFQSGGSTAIPRLRTDIEKYLAGQTADLPQGRIDAISNFLSAVKSSNAGETTLWRGMSIPGDIDTVAARYQAGQDLDLSLASFSTDKKLAQEFTLQGAGQKVRAATKTPVLVEWVGGGKRALPIENLSKSGVFAKEKEWVGAGRYQIQSVKRTKRNGIETVVIQILQKGAW